MHKGYNVHTVCNGGKLRHISGNHVSARFYMQSRERRKTRAGPRGGLRPRGRGVVGRRGCLRSVATLLGRPFSARATVVGTGRALATAYATSGAVARVACARKRYLGIVRTRLVRRAAYPLRIEIHYNNRRPAEITGKWISR